MDPEGWGLVDINFMESMSDIIGVGWMNFDFLNGNFKKLSKFPF